MSGKVAGHPSDKRKLNITNEYSSKSSGTGRDHQRAKPEVRKRTDEQMQHHPASIRRQVRGHLRGHHAGQHGTM